MVERYYDPNLKGKFKGIEDFLYKVISKYKQFLDKKNIKPTREELVRCVKFLKTGVFNRFNAQTNLNLILRYNNNSILNIEIGKGFDRHDPIMIYLDDEHIDDLYERDVNVCEDYNEKGDFEEMADGKWVRYFDIKLPVTAPKTPPSEQMPCPLPKMPMLPSKQIESKPKSKLENVLNGLRSMDFKN